MRFITIAFVAIWALTCLILPLAGSIALAFAMLAVLFVWAACITGKRYDEEFERIEGTGRFTTGVFPISRNLDAGAPVELTGAEIDEVHGGRDPVLDRLDLMTRWKRDLDYRGIEPPVSLMKALGEQRQKVIYRDRATGKIVSNAFRRANPDQVLVEQVVAKNQNSGKPRKSPRRVATQS